MCLLPTEQSRSSMNGALNSLENFATGNFLPSLVVDTGKIAMLLRTASTKNPNLLFKELKFKWETKKKWVY